MTPQSPRQVDEHFAKSFNDGDIEGVLALYEPDATLVAQPGNPITGQQSLREALAEFMGMRGQIDLRTGPVTESGPLALALTDWTLTGGTDPDGNPVELSGRASMVLRRQDDGSWRIAIDDPWSTS